MEAERDPVGVAREICLRQLAVRARSRAELAKVYHKLGRYGDARALLLNTVSRLQRILPDDDPLILELREILADIGDE